MTNYLRLKTEKSQRSAENSQRLRQVKHFQNQTTQLQDQQFLNSTFDYPSTVVNQNGIVSSSLLENKSNNFRGTQVVGMAGSYINPMNVNENHLVIGGELQRQNYQKAKSQDAKSRYANSKMSKNELIRKSQPSYNYKGLSNNSQTEKIDLKFKKAQIGYKFYTTLKGQVSQNQDLEHIVDTNQSLYKDTLNDEQLGSSRDKLQKMENSNKLGGNNLKYHMIRKILESKDAEEIKELLNKQNKNEPLSESQNPQVKIDNIGDFNSQGKEQVLQEYLKVQPNSKHQTSLLLKDLSIDSHQNLSISKEGSLCSFEGSAKKIKRNDQGILIKISQGKYNIESTQITQSRSVSRNTKMNVTTSNFPFHSTNSQYKSNNNYGTTDDNFSLQPHTKKIELAQFNQQDSKIMNQYFDKRGKSRESYVMSPSNKHKACHRFMTKSNKYQENLIKYNRSRERQDICFQGNQQNLQQRYRWDNLNMSKFQSDSFNQSIEKQKASVALQKNESTSQKEMLNYELLGKSQQLLSQMSQKKQEQESTTISKLEKYQLNIHQQSIDQTLLKPAIKLGKAIKVPSIEYHQDEIQRFSNTQVIQRGVESSPTKNEYKKRVLNKSPVVNRDGKDSKLKSMQQRQLITGSIVSSQLKLYNSEINNQQASFISQGTQIKSDLMSVVADREDQDTQNKTLNLTMILPNLNKKHQVSMQQQVISHSKDFSNNDLEKQFTKSEIINKATEAKLQNDIRQYAIINSFERLNQQMKNQRKYHLSQALNRTQDYEQYNNDPDLLYADRSDNKFFQALNYQFQRNKAKLQRQQDNQLMEQTKQEMTEANKSKHEKLQKHIYKTGCPFTVAKNAFNMHSQIQVQKLFGDLSKHDKNKVPLLKQNCLLEFIKDAYHNELGNQAKLRQYKYFCQCTNNGQAYSLVIYGIDTPITNCCKQLVCFQFCKDVGSLKILCLDPLCQFNPLEQKLLHHQFLDVIFNTPNDNPLNQFNTLIKDDEEDLEELLIPQSSAIFDSSFINNHNDEERSQQITRTQVYEMKPIHDDDSKQTLERLQKHNELSNSLDNILTQAKQDQIINQGDSERVDTSNMKIVNTLQLTFPDNYSLSGQNETSFRMQEIHQVNNSKDQ
eukprot:403333625